MNNRLTRIALAACLALLPGAGWAAPLPSSIADAVRAELADGFGPYRAAEIPAPRRLARPIDVNHDGVTDWLVDYEGARFAYWCGTGGCLQQLWVSHAGGYVLAFENQVLELKLRRGDTGVIDVELHGVHCNRTGAEECSRSFRWDEGLARFQEVPNRKGATLLTGPLFQTVLPKDADLPNPVRDARADLKQACRARGGRYIEYGVPVASLPDLDGDDRRDWIVDGSLTECDVAGSADEGQPGSGLLRLFYSGSGRMSEAPRPQRDGYDIDIASRPARLIERAAELGADAP